MTEMERISDQLRRSYDGPAWHGPWVKDVLEGVNAAQAAHRPIANAHSIWELVLHMTTWQDVVRRRALGETVKVTDAENFPKVTDRSEAAWKAALARLESVHRELERTVADLPLHRLDEPLVPGGNTGFIQLHGIVQHDLYHAGQIAILKKTKPGAKRTAGPKRAASARRATKPARSRGRAARARAGARSRARRRGERGSRA